MIKRILLVILSLCLTHCKAQKMNTITLDSNGETKQLYENSMFKENYSVKEGNTIIEKANQKPFSGKLVINYHSGEIYATYNYINGKQEGNQLLYFINGNKRADLTIQKGKYQNESIYYYENGNKKSIAIYNDGIKIKSKNFYENGFIMDEMSYENEKKHGESKIYYDNGKLKSTANYERGTLKGKVFNYYKNGALESKGEIYEENAFKEYKTGVWEYFYENGNKKEEGAWGMGGRHGDRNTKKGVWKYYNENGELTATEEYDTMGRAIKKQKYGN